MADNRQWVIQFDVNHFTNVDAWWVPTADDNRKAFQEAQNLKEAKKSLIPYLHRILFEDGEIYYPKDTLA